MLLLSLPIFLEAEYILGIWLVDVPPATVIFLRFILISFLFRAPSRPLINGVHATGDVKFLNLTSGLHVLITYCPAIYFLYLFGFPVWTCCVVLLYRNVVSTVLEALSLKRKIKFSLRKYFWSVYGKSIFIALLASMIAILPCVFMERSFVRFILTIFVSVLSCAVSIWHLGLTVEFRARLLGFCKNRLILR
jgi:hypothetical protein